MNSEYRNNFNALEFGDTRKETIVKNIMWPSEEKGDVTSHYARWIKGPPRLAQKDDGSFLLPIGSIVDFTTHANAIENAIWMKLCGKENKIGLALDGRGRVIVELLDCTETGAYLIIATQTINLDDSRLLIYIENKDILVGERLGFRVTAHSDATLCHAAWFVNGACPRYLEDKPNTSEWVLQRFILPDETRADKTSLYAQWPQGNVKLATEKGQPLPPLTAVNYTTFFNCFSHRKWHSLTGLSNLTLRLTGHGKLRIFIKSVSEEGKSHIEINKLVCLENTGVDISLGNPGQIIGEILGLEVEALEESALLTSASWITTEAPLRQVNLAAIVTTFQREDSAEAAALRFSQNVIPFVPIGSAELFIIDNGQSLALPKLPGVTVYGNKNLGGAGGFARGLIEAQNSGRFTHALFMDDDASAEPETVWRTMALLSRLIDNRASVTGAMLLSDNPWFQYEKGAKFQLSASKRDFWRSPLSGRDLTKVHVIASNEMDDDINYGAWWFFAFPISAVRSLPFPFFVRGDDVDFSLINEFPVTTLNGVASWCDSFATKLNPSTEYLAWRSWLALALMHTESQGHKYRLLKTLLVAVRLGWRFDYAGMEAVIDGVETAMGGPESFGKKPAPIEALQRAKSRIVKHEINAEIIRKAVPIYPSQSYILKALSLLSIGGNLLPQRIMRQEVRHVPIAWNVGITSVLRAPALLFGSGSDLQLVTRDRARFASGVWRTIVVGTRAFMNLGNVSKNYKDNSSAYRTLDYWNSVLGLKDTKSQ